MDANTWLRLAEAGAFGWIDGTFTLLAGVYVLGLYHGFVPFKSRDGTTHEQWKEKHGRTVLLCAWALIAVSLLRIVGIIRW